MSLAMPSGVRALRAPVPTPKPLVVVSMHPLAAVWLVREADQSTREVYDGEEDAIARARHILRRRGGGRVRVLRRDGSVAREVDVRA